MTEQDDTEPKPRTWLERISHALLGEPQDQAQLLSLLRDAQQRALLNHDALSMIEGVLQVSDMRVEEIMIPKAEMIVIEKEKPFSEMIQVIIESAHSRYPVIGEDGHEVIGILLAKDLLTFQYHVDKAEWDQRFNLKDSLRPVVFIPESKRLDVLLKDFRNNRNHLAMVVDEYGKITGLVTIEDVLEQIVGDIEDEHDIEDAPNIRQYADDHFAVKATTPLEEFNTYFQCNLSAETVDTIGGRLLNELGYLPKRGEVITLENLNFKILKANIRRIQLLSVTRLP